jgi:hypothetical protein
MEAAARPQWKGAAAAPPLYRQRLDETFWFSWLEDTGTLYVSFRRYDHLRAKARELWSFVDGHRVNRIAIDLRQNGGGDFKRRPQAHGRRARAQAGLRAYVLIGPRTFSAALKNAIDFRTVAHATLVGETIAERPNSYSENDEMTLPHTRIVISYSTKYYKFLPDDGLVRPDKEILPSWADWTSGRDPVLEWVTAQ